MDFKIREDRRPQGSKKLTREREAYFLLMRQGVSNTEACRILGINRRTGKRWRHGTDPDREQEGGNARDAAGALARPVALPAGSGPHPHR